MSNKCLHQNISCINPYELIRKYRCLDCGGVMMCGCEKDFAIKYLPHQIDYGVELNTRKRIPVNLGFQENICNTCRGIPEEAYPKAPLYGAKNKIQRYYWREIAFETMKRFGEWAESQGYKDNIDALTKKKEKYKEIGKEVISEIKKLHNDTPKYQFKEKSQQEVISENNVEVLELREEYVKNTEGRVQIKSKDNLYSIEEFVCEYFSQENYRSIQTESSPFHVLFGTFFWLLIQDSVDPKNRMAGFSDRFGMDDINKRNKIWTSLPEDFGTSVYYERRKYEIKGHLTDISRSKDGLLWSFDYWIYHSYNFRNYLWAHKQEDIYKARQIITILPLEKTINILHYLIKNYWRNYLGWPDLFLYNDFGYLFIEVKSVNSSFKCNFDIKKTF